jgi:hypothetical protein
MWREGEKMKATAQEFDNLERVKVRLVSLNSLFLNLSIVV